MPMASVVLLVGSGNNGGDALWAGARLARLRESEARATIATRHERKEDPFA
ncbi:NAD(P)H-hydrate epimerase, partial [Sphingomonas bacterium]|uniref:NAD(P)H-hydrate epimerase n=1 Tax=Sphingomonas bacterium TaxID=1895847 RepID=UPI001C2DC262